MYGFETEGIFQNWEDIDHHVTVLEDEEGDLAIHMSSTLHELIMVRSRAHPCREQVGRPVSNQ